MDILTFLGAHCFLGKTNMEIMNNYIITHSFIYSKNIYPISGIYQVLAMQWETRHVTYTHGVYSRGDSFMEVTIKPQS